MSSLWNIDNKNESTAETLQFIKDEANALSEITNGVVLAKFIRKRTGSADALIQAAQTLDPSQAFLGKTAKQDASKLYRRQAYEFFITDKDRKYELSVFYLVCNDEYPIEISVDPSIADEAGMPQGIEIDSFSEFCGYYEKIVSTHKVNYIIRTLMHMNK